MDFNKADHGAVCLHFRPAVDASGKQQEGEFSEKERNSEIQAKLCEWLKEGREVNFVWEDC